MKAYYSCLDTGFVKYCPQSLQHLAVANKAGKLGGEVSFYTMEDPGALAFQGAVKAKIEENPAVDGIIYFTVRQFFYGGNFDLKFLKFVLDQGYEVHFAREDISILNRDNLADLYPILYSSRYLLDRDEDREYWRPVWDWVKSAPDGSVATNP